MFFTYLRINNWSFYFISSCFRYKKSLNICLILLHINESQLFKTKVNYSKEKYELQNNWCITFYAFYKKEKPNGPKVANRIVFTKTQQRQFVKNGRRQLKKSKEQNVFIFQFELMTWLTKVTRILLIAVLTKNELTQFRKQSSWKFVNNLYKKWLKE